MAKFLKLRIFVLFWVSGCAGGPEYLSGVAAANAGPCPAAMALYDTARMVEIGDEELHSHIGFTGEIMSVRTSCRYAGEEPIQLHLEVDFALGKGEAATAVQHRYEWYVAVTRRNKALAASERLSFTVEFPEGQEIVHHTEVLEGIVIPRSSAVLSGSNFEILTGFVLTPEQLSFNQSGKRFRIDAGG